MTEPSKIIPLKNAPPADDSARLAVTLTVGELRGLIASVVRETVNHLLPPFHARHAGLRTRR